MRGNILQIDLTRRESKVEPLPAGVLGEYLGGRGLGAYLLCREVRPGTPPLSAKNHLIFSAGPGNGTGLLFGSKTVVTTKSPLTGIYLFSISSGSFGHQLRRAGYYALDISGVSDRPVYLRIENDSIRFEDAASCWGMEPVAAQQIMLGGRSSRKAATLAIGPAGERRAPYAAIMAEGNYYRTFGRGGSGAVMGAKNLKGVVVSGNAVVLPADTPGFSQLKRRIITAIRENPKYVHMRRSYGTGSDLKLMSRLGTLPVRNWQYGQMARAASICTEDIELPRRNITCGPNCPVPCSHLTEVPDGEYAGATCDGPEYETIYAFGSNCGIESFEAIVAAAQLCDAAGLDTISAGCSIAFAMECFERDLITVEDTGGMNLRFGDAAAMLAALKMLIAGEGFGARLAQGVRSLSREIPGSEDFAMHSKGLELGGYECRGLMGQALQIAVNNRGGCHHGYGLPARSESLDGSGPEIPGKGARVRDLAIGRIVRDSIPICTFPGVIVTDALLPEIISSLTGTPWTAADVARLGRRIMAQERLFNMSEGLSREHDTLPKRLTREPKPDGPSAGAVVPLETLKDDYYAALGWDANGNPTPQELKRLGIGYP